MAVIQGYAKITQLPDGQTPLSGTELIEMVQAGQSVKFPISSLPSTQSGFIVISDTPALPLSRVITAGNGISFTDGGPGGNLVIEATGDITFGAPSGLIGLTPVTGVATTAIASDSTHALSQAIAPVWTGIHLWTNLNGLLVLNTLPLLELFESDAASNNGRWQVRAQGEQLLISTISNDGLTTANAIVIDRTATVIDSVNLTAAVAQVNGQNIRDAAILTSGTVATARLGSGTADATTFLRGDQTWQLGTSIFAGFANPSASIGLAAVNGSASTAMRSDAAPALSQAIAPTWTGLHTFSSTDPILRLNETDAAANNRVWQIESNGEQFLLRVGNDALSSFANFMAVDRTLNVIDSIALTATTLTLNGTAIPTGLANPSASIGLAAVNGTATTAMRSDAAPALSVAIVPTWTGQHTWTQDLLGPNGTAPLPAFAFSGDPNTGLYNVGADDLGLATAGVLRLDISTTNVTSTLPWLGADGLVGTPGLSFSADPNTGIRRIGADNISIVTGGTDRITVSSTGLVTFVAPSSGQAFEFNVVQGSFARIQGPNTGVGWNVGFYDTTNAVFRGFIGVGTNTVAGAAATDFGISPGASGNIAFGTPNGVSLAFKLNGATTTGTSTPGALSANKPGANASVIAWLPVITAAGASGWIPIWGN